MGIIDVRGKGGKPLQLKGDLKMDDDQKKDPIQELEEATYRGDRYRAYRRAAGLDDAHSIPVEREETTKVDLGAIFAAQSDLVKTSLAKVDEMRSTSQASGRDLYLTHLETELQEMRQRLNNPGPDPVLTLVQHQEQLKTLAQSLKQTLGLPEGIQVGGQDVSKLIDLEHMKQVEAERTRQWNESMEERRQQWKKEDKREEEKFRLARLQFVDDRQSRSRATDALEDLVGALSDSIGIAEEGGVSSRGHRPKAFKCSDCGAVVKVSSPEAIEAMCESCGQWFDLVHSDEVAAPQT